MMASPPPWRAALRDVLLVAGLAVGGVLGAAALTERLPGDVRAVIIGTPWAIILLVIVTGFVLWRAAGRRPPEE